MDKENQYRELIDDVKRFYENEARLHQHEPLYLGWYDDVFVFVSVYGMQTDAFAF